MVRMQQCYCGEWQQTPTELQSHVNSHINMNSMFTVSVHTMSTLCLMSNLWANKLPLRALVWSTSLSKHGYSCLSWRHHNVLMALNFVYYLAPSLVTYIKKERKKEMSIRLVSLHFQLYAA